MENKIESRKENSIGNNKGNFTGEARSGARGKSRCAGETMVEVMVSAVIFLLFMAVFQGAVSFCTTAQEKSRVIRANTAAISSALLEQEAAPTEDGEPTTFQFYAASADGKQYGNQVFQITVREQSREVSYIDTEGNDRTVEFAVYGTDKTAAAGTTGGGTNETNADIDTEGAATAAAASAVPAGTDTGAASAAAAADAGGGG